MKKIKLIKVSNVGTDSDSWGNKISSESESSKQVYVKQLETTIKEHYLVINTGKYTKTIQLLMNKFEYNNEEKVEIDGVVFDIIRAKQAFKNPQKLLLVVAI